eukprot:CAMPEP_0177580866 /NCGR_PEP_ID=MMETSP0419_2-20121207/1818_1 /TAXON_ID=582737 /ORGANISM="Tetraselmis sp., Strain GSL018" /LENGTH=299 /DNA_ID=CAMNT_0019069821 /DNA_START=625 /DNA_END=1525 /DNA_ORIENTATION=-
MATEWETLRIDERLPSRSLGSLDAHTQVYAGGEFCAADVEALKPGPLAAEPPRGSAGPVPGKRRAAAAPITVPAMDALATVRRRMRSPEEDRCREIAASRIGGPYSQMLVDAEVEVEPLRKWVVHVPAYVFRHRHRACGLEAEVYTFVAGIADGRVGGPRIPDPVKVSVAAGAAVGALAVGLGHGSASDPVELALLYVLTPSLLAGYMAMLQPVAVQLFRRQKTWLKGFSKTSLVRMARTGFFCREEQHGSYINEDASDERPKTTEEMWDVAGGEADSAVVAGHWQVLIRFLLGARCKV